MAAFYLDNDVNIRVSTLLRAADHHAITTRDLGLESASDEEQLLLAAQQGWIFVSHNEADFVLLDAAWQLWTAA